MRAAGCGLHGAWLARRSRLALLGVGGMACVAATAGAQPRAAMDTTRSPQPATRAPEPAPHRVSGHIVRPGADGEVPVADTWVTLHRVGPDAAGPLDSLRVGRDGRFAFAYPRTGSEEAVYFVSASYGGIAYFAEPLREDDRNAVTEITVFDTTTAPIPLTVRGRHLVVSAAAPSGRRTVTEVYELSNDTTLTAIAPPNGATFTAALPAGATEPQVGTGDVSPEAVAFTGGRVRVAAPFSPGLKQLSFAYTLGPEHFPLRLPVLGGAGVLEVLVEEPTAQVSGAGLAAVDPATVDGRTFKRFLAQDVAPNALARVDVPPPPAIGRTGYLALLAAVIGGAMLVALVRALTVRRRPALALALPGAASSDRIAHEIAALDAAFERRPPASEAERASYAERRAALKAQLSAALADRRA